MFFMGTGTAVVGVSLGFRIPINSDWHTTYLGTWSRFYLEDSFGFSREVVGSHKLGWF